MRVWRPRKNTSVGITVHDRFAVKCVCEHVVSGDRTSESQVVACPECGEELYVLPRDVYPRPKILEQPAQAREQPTAITFSEAGEDLLQESPQSETQNEDNSRLARPVDDTPERIWIDRPHGGHLRKRIAQLLLLTAVVALVASIAVSWRNHLDRAEEQYRLASDDAWAEVNRGDFEGALEKATLAKNALDDLGWDDPASRDLVVLERELRILNRLSGLSAVEIVLQKQEGEFSKADWRSHFSVHHTGNWLLMEGEVVRKKGEETTRYRFDFPASLESETVEFLWEQPPEWVTQLDYRDERAIVFGAFRIETLRFPEEETSRWQILLSGDESYLWSQPLLLEKLYQIDFRHDAYHELGDRIRAQRLLQGLGESPE